MSVWWIGLHVDLGPWCLGLRGGLGFGVVTVARLGLGLGLGVVTVASCEVVTVAGWGGCAGGKSLRL